MDQSRVTAIHPHLAVEGGRISIYGADFPVDGLRLPDVRIADRPARIVYASSTRIDAIVPSGLSKSGAASVLVEGVASEAAFLEIAGPFATGLHQVDSPVFSPDGVLYVTYSGTRGQSVPVSIFRVWPDGKRETFCSGIVNPTSLTVDAHGELFVSSRFDGTVYRIGSDGLPKPFATDLGVACGLAFARDGTLFVGDRSGTVFTVDRSGHATSFAVLPSSVAAFHLAVAPDDSLYVTGPTLASYDAVYRILPDATVTIVSENFGRPQGLTFDSSGTLYVVEALAGMSGLYRLAPGRDPEIVVAGPDLVGVAFDRHGALVVCSNESAYRFSYQIAS